MIRRWCTCLLVQLALTATVAHAAAPPPVLHLVHAQMLQVDSAVLAPEPAPRQVDSRVLVGAWRDIALPFAPGARRLLATGASADSITWFRIAVPPFAPPAAALYLYVNRIQAAGSIAFYVDGKLLDQRQLDGPTWHLDPVWLAVDGGQRVAPPREILVRVQHPRRATPALASLWLGADEAIGWRYQGRLWAQLYVPVMGVGAFFAVGIFALFVWLRRGGGAGYGLFALLATVQFVHALGFFCEVHVRDVWFAWLMNNTLFWSLLIVHAIQVWCHGRRQRALRDILVVLAAAVAVISLPGVATPTAIAASVVAAIVAGIAITIAGVLGSWRRSAEGMLVAIGVALCVVYGVNDWLLQSNLIGVEGWYLGPYMNLQNFITLCYLMYRRYARAQTRVARNAVALAQGLVALEAELAAGHERLRQVEYDQTVARERQRLMQDMHDGLGSSLHSALRAIECGRLDPAAVAGILHACIDDLHLTIDALEPVEADLLLLLATLRYRLAGRLQDAGIALHWQVADVAQLDWLDPDAALHILRVLQEALTNIAKHTAATEITVSTADAGDGVQVVIADNGAGFDPAAALERGGHGLRNQQCRVASIGGCIDWQSSPAGTRVVLWLPTARATAVLI